MKEKTVCFECGVVLTEGNSYTLDGNTMCEECFERLTTNCDNCSTRIWRDNAEGDSNYINSAYADSQNCSSFCASSAVSIVSEGMIVVHMQINI